MSTRSEQSVSKRIDVIILSLIHENAQSKAYISSCKTESLLYTCGLKDSGSIWSLRLHPESLILLFLIHDTSIWQVKIRGIQEGTVSSSIVGDLLWSSIVSFFSLTFFQHSASRDTCWRLPPLNYEINNHDIVLVNIFNQRWYNSSIQEMKNPLYLNEEVL